MNDKAGIGSAFSDIIYLALCWALTLTTSTLLTSIGPLSAKSLGASTAVAPFTIGVFLFGAAFSSVPSGALFRKYGRMKGFSVGCLCQVIGCLFGSGGMMFEDLTSVFAGCFFVGLGQGLGQFYRFSAVEIAPANYKSQAITYVLSGGVLAAFLGPTSASYSVHLVGHEYLGGYMLMGVMGILNQIMVMMIRFPDSENSALTEKLNPNTVNRQNKPVLAIDPNSDIIVDEHSPLHGERSGIVGPVFPPVIPIAEVHRPLKEIVTDPLFVISCTVATMAHTEMVMIMSNCSLAMDENYDYSFGMTALVMEVHFCSMFLPGFFTGKLITQYGSFLVALGGVLIYLLSSVMFLIGHSAWNFFSGMALLGIAWNFSFSAGTVMLTGSYRKCEATDVQAINDFILFTVAGIGSLISGVLYSSLGWYVLVYVVSGMMIVNIALFGIAWNMKQQIDKSVEEAEGEIVTEHESNSVVENVTSDLSPPADPLSFWKPNPISRKDSRSISTGSRSTREPGRGSSFADMFVPAPTEELDDHDKVRSISVA